MRPLTSLHEGRAYSPQNFGAPVQNEFCNTIGIRQDYRLYRPQSDQSLRAGQRRSAEAKPRRDIYALPAARQSGTGQGNQLAARRARTVLPHHPRLRPGAGNRRSVKGTGDLFGTAAAAGGRLTKRIVRKSGSRLSEKIIRQ